MSVRIYQLSKDLGIENKELISLLNERGYSLKSASSTVDNITAESLLSEFGKNDSGQPNSEENTQESSSKQEEVIEQKKVTKPKITLPEGVFVKSKKDVAEEREAKKEAKRAVIIPAPLSSPPPIIKAPPPTPKKSVPPPINKTMPAPAIPPTPTKKVEPQTTESGEVTQLNSDSDEPKIIQIKPPIVVRDFAAQLNLKPFKLISELMEHGIFSSMNQAIDENIAIRIANKHNFKLEIRHRGEGQSDELKKKVEKPKEDESKLLEPRPPVICVLGHVDHGKTTLLDAIRKTNVVAGEAGGITQHIGAYQIEHKNQKLTFIDTPGHAAFSKMRQRGADVTDIAILVVAADDGFMPQTDEALKFAQDADVPIIVAINKMDAPGADINRVKTLMQERNIASEDWGGEILTISISALKNENIDDLVDAILLQAEIMDTVKANPNCDAEGFIIESQKEVGKGSTATIIVKRGTLKPGDSLVCGNYFCKARALIDENGKNIKSAPPSTPVKVIGWSGAPESGTIFTKVKNEKEAKRISEENLHNTKLANNVEKQPVEEGDNALDTLFAAIEKTQKNTFKILIKADVYGAAEALAACLEDITSDKIQLEVVETSVGLISKNDVLLASATEATIIGFNVGLDNGVSAFAKHHGIKIYHHNIIYELIDIVREAMIDLLEPELKENKLGVAQIRAVFTTGKGVVAGCMVTEGKIVRDKFARISSDKDKDKKRRVVTLKRFKDDANEVRAGLECGIRLENLNDYKEGDLIECFEYLKIKPAL